LIGIVNPTTSNAAYKTTDGTWFSGWIDGPDDSTATFAVTPAATFAPTAGPVGTTITAGGPGWVASDNITGVTINAQAATKTLTVSAGGVLSGTITVPTGIVIGANDIIITGTGSGAQTYTGAFTGRTATGATFTGSPGPVGTTSTVAGTGFVNSDTITGVTVGGTAAAKSLVVSAGGVLSGTITVPVVTQGAKSVVITGATSGAQTQVNTFTVTSVGSFAPIQGPVGTLLTVTGNGWTASDTITGVAPVTGVTVKAINAAHTLVVSATGVLSGTITVPAGILIGANTIVATGTTTGAVTLTPTFQGIIPASFNPIAGAYNTVITVTGTGWSASEVIAAGNVTVGGVLATHTLVVSAGGALSGTITVPIGAAAGLGAITITGSVTTIQTYTGAFTVTPNAIYLGTGWNLISYPLVPIPNPPLIGTVLAGISANVNAVWYYDPSVTPAVWKSWSPVVGPTYTLTTIEDGKAYWFDMTAPATLAVAGTIQPAPPATPRAYAVVPGWNMVGYKSDVNPVAFRTNTVYLGAAILANVQRMYRFDNATQAWVDVTTAGTNWNPGEGWWISTTTAGTIYP
jgi:hypothetical protein